MAVLTVREAAQRLGVKPGKVRLYISQRKLSAHPASSRVAAGRAAELLLDADEVETLARVRVHKRMQRTGATAEQPDPDSDSEPDQSPGEDWSAEPVTAAAAMAHREDPNQVQGPAHEAPLTGEVENAVSDDVTGWRAASLVQSVVTPLIAELRDSRETIRRQAEELGALRATVAELERRAAVNEIEAAPRHSGAVIASRGGLAPPSEDGNRDGAMDPMDRPSQPPQPASFPLWRRALFYVRDR